jgi:primosomal protein DnaI
MESIKDTFKKLNMKNGFQQRYNEMKQEVLNNRDVQKFLLEHVDLMNNGLLEKNMMTFYEYVSQSKNCDKCTSLTDCQNLLQGYHPFLEAKGKAVVIQYEKCPKKLAFDESKRYKSLITSMHIPKDVLEASMTALDLDDPSRFSAIKAASHFLEHYEKGKRVKGLYFHGKFGVGKTYILGAVANELANRGIQSMLVYVPEFFRELKGAIQDSSISKKLEAVKEVPILMLDDIGAESMSSWVRDDILGSLLQFRMLENLPTFFTSNFNLVQLEHHLTYTQRGEEEQLKAKRLIERIKYLSEPVEVNGKNRRD